ncbi:hypothetical protein WR25_08158 [Diploscapter pachys]|uniref:Uncharacterized protein n=1 Tax=Diploscapter pachys TaxID=2018661 RepID=A0A2A2LSL1_9BILA|nr:hypothetical protein WR25_08158 [Diploscapter pachys]
MTNFEWEHCIGLSNPVVTIVPLQSSVASIGASPLNSVPGLVVDVLLSESSHDVRQLFDSLDLVVLNCRGDYTYHSTSISEESVEFDGGESLICIEEGDALHERTDEQLESLLALPPIDLQQTVRQPHCGQLCLDVPHPHHWLSRQEVHLFGCLKHRH